MGACETTPPATHTRGTQPAPSLPRLSIIGRRSPASSSFVLAAARLRALQLDPGHAAAETQQPPGKGPAKANNPKPGNHTQVTRPDQHAP